MKSSSSIIDSSSPALRSASCSSSLARCSNGSINSEYAFTISPRVDHNLKHVEPCRVVVTTASQWNHLDGVMQEKRRLNQVGTNGLLVEQIDETRHRIPARRNRPSKPHVLMADFNSFNSRIARRSIPGLLQDGLTIVHLLPVATKVQLCIQILDCQRAAELLNNRLNKFADETHVVLVVPVGGIPFKHGEFLEVGRVDPFISEVSAEFEHAFERSGHEPF